mmetsp:Transcript_50494/g.93297  ORF Transcript_50494/g.93297 Transcript_50494/m.93297 type:complete len:277 (-) Transcript_50494:2025-2855(-)
MRMREAFRSVARRLDVLPGLERRRRTRRTRKPKRAAPARKMTREPRRKRTRNPRRRRRSASARSASRRSVRSARSESARSARTRKGREKRKRRRRSKQRRKKRQRSERLKSRLSWKSPRSSANLMRKSVRNAMRKVLKSKGKLSERRGRHKRGRRWSVFAKSERSGIINWPSVRFSARSGSASVRRRLRSERRETVRIGRRRRRRGRSARRLSRSWRMSLQQSLCARQSAERKTMTTTLIQLDPGLASLGQWEGQQEGPEVQAPEDQRLKLGHKVR